MTQGQRSYRAFLRAIKAEQGLNQKQAQTAYRALKERLDRPPAKADIKRHPRMTRDAVKKATEPPAKKKRPAKKEPPKPAPKKKPVKKEPPAKKKRRAPPGVGGQVFHAGIRYRKGKGKDAEQLRIEVVLKVAPGVPFDPSQLNATAQHWAQTKELPKGVSIDVVTWQHNEGAQGFAETPAAIEDARAKLISRIAGAGEFHDVGGSEGNGDS